jgi:hypothetical protein
MLGVFCTITAGHPEAFVISLTTAGAYALCRVFGQHSGRVELLARLGLGCLAGLLLAAPAWLSFWDASSIAFNAHGEGAAYSGRIAVAPHTIAEYFFP